MVVGSGTLAFAVELDVVDIVDDDVLLHGAGRLFDLVKTTVEGVEVAEAVLIVDVLVRCLLAVVGVEEDEEDDDEEVFMKCK